MSIRGQVASLLVALDGDETTQHEIRKQLPPGFVLRTGHNSVTAAMRDALRQFHRGGLVERDGFVVTIKDRAGLRAFAEHERRDRLS